MADIGKDIALAGKLLLTGKLVAVPTETVYGLAANALNEQAVLKIFETKNRPHFDPLIIHVHSAEVVNRYATMTDQRLKNLAKKFWPGPLTLLLPKKHNIHDLVTAGLDRVAVRIPNHPLTLALLRAIDIPLAAPSANPFGYVSPTQPDHVNKQLGHQIDYILDGGAAVVGIESTIVGVEDDKVCLYRLGGLPVEQIENVCGEIELRINQSSDPKAPGQLKSHYAPKKPLYIGDLQELIKSHMNKKIAVICFGKSEFLLHNNLLVYNLSQNNDTGEAAANLFNYLRQADDSDAEMVICEYLPENGLGIAINDRLKRAATKI